MFSLTKPTEALKLQRTESLSLRQSTFKTNPSTLELALSRALLIRPTMKLVTEQPLLPSSLEPSLNKDSRKSNQESTQLILKKESIKQSSLLLKILKPTPPKSKEDKLSQMLLPSQPTEIGKSVTCLPICMTKSAHTEP